MANRMTNSQYQNIKNETYTIVKFKDGRRVITISGLSFYRVAQEMIETRSEMVILVINEKDLPQSTYGGRIPHHSYDIKDYEEYFKMQRRVF